MTRDQERRTRSRASRRLRATDAAAEFVVTIGGFSVLAAVLGICVYLAYVVVPLFSSGTVEDPRRGAADPGASIVDAAVGPYAQIGVLLLDNGAHALVRLEGGGVFAAGRDADDEPPTATAIARNGELLAYGYADGTVRLGSIRFETELLAQGDPAPEDVKGIVTELESGRRRVVRVEDEMGDAIALGAGSGAVEMLDYRLDPTGKTTLAATRADGTVIVSSVRTIRPLGGGAPRTRLNQTSVTLPDPSAVAGIRITADGDDLLVVTDDATLVRFGRSDTGFVERERVRLFEGRGTRIGPIDMLFGGQTLLVADEAGRIESWHASLDERDRHGDGRMLVRSHAFRVTDDRVVDLRPSARDRSIAVLDAGGRVTLRHMTSEKEIISFGTALGEGAIVAIAPRNDAVLVIDAGGGYEIAAYEPGYPGFGVKALFGEVHYEGLPEPAYVYQSSSGSDSAEVKLNLVPLIFGTLKATVFAMLFAIPIGVLAAMYSSEFLSKRVRRAVKPTVELMASLPSVVLGFVAAIVVAPFVRDHLIAFVSGLVVVPIVILLVAHVWQIAPIDWRRRLGTGHHLLLVLAALALGVGVSIVSGPMIERVLFAPSALDRAVIARSVEEAPDSALPGWALGDELTTRERRMLRERGFAVVDDQIVRPDPDGPGSTGELDDGDMRRWLNGEYATAAGGWIPVLVPVAALGVWFAQAAFVRRRLDVRLADASALVIGVWALIKFALGASAAVAIAAGAAHALAWWGIDPRDSIMGTFSPRNTFVVALIMGFAVIPIIFTISEDALQAVPDTLRTASLGSGATRWQTATRIVLPVAASGIFSACMIGFGRAVGETMIVLMATGNTPEMSWNIFSGFRTLAANIAVELPEAPKGGTHYRVLFLCGLVLFVMTFVINTSAELVRRWVRSRNAGL